MNPQVRKLLKQAKKTVVFTRPKTIQECIDATHAHLIAEADSMGTYRGIEVVPTNELFYDLLTRVEFLTDEVARLNRLALLGTDSR